MTSTNHATKSRRNSAGNVPRTWSLGQKKTIQAALFLEIARELDEKELEIESSYVRLNAIEEEFRDIVGIEEVGNQRSQSHPSSRPR